MKKIKRGFDSIRYIRFQKSEIDKRVKKFGKLYLEVGGKLVYDSHASRVLPGFDPTTKIKIIQELKNTGIIYCVNAKDLERKRIIHDFGLDYRNHALKDLKDIKKFGIEIICIVITRYSGQKSALKFKKKLEKLRYKVFLHKEIPGYYTSIKNILSGFEKQPYIDDYGKNIVIITGVASGSGKMAVALNQIYHQEKYHKKGKKSGFAKWETFPVWDLPQNHPINLAYEAATADLGDSNKVDRSHLKEYGIKATNYNRDIENFKILKRIVYSITKEKYPLGYKSPTDMGVNMIKRGIIDEEICIKASKEEIIRRYYSYKEDVEKGLENQKTLRRMREIMKKAGLKIYE